MRICCCKIPNMSTKRSSLIIVKFDKKAKQKQSFLIKNMFSFVEKAKAHLFVTLAGATCC